MKKILLFMAAFVVGLSSVQAAKYVKVTSAPTDWSGKYILVYEHNADSAYVFTGVEAASNYEYAPISSNSISGDKFTTLTLADTTDGYSIKVNGGANDGKFIASSNNSNGLAFGSSAAIMTLSCADNSVLITNAGGAVMRFNKSKDQLRFRYYKAASYTNQQPVQLYKLQSDGPSASTLSEALAGKTIRRAVSDANYVYVLAVDSAKNPTLVKADFTGKVVTTYNTDFCSVSTDGVMKLSDIALTEDGVLVGCNQEKCQFAYSGNTNALNIYKWAEDGTGSVDFTYAYAYLVSMTWGNGYTGVTMAVKGTLADGQILIAGQSASGSAKDKMKQLLMEIKNDSVNKASVNTQEKKIIPGLQNINYPATSQFITMGTEKVPQLFEYDNTGGIDKYEVEKGALPADYKGVTGATVCTFGAETWMVIPSADSVKVLDVTNGLASATVKYALAATSSIANDFKYAAVAGNNVVLMRDTTIEVIEMPIPTLDKVLAGKTIRRAVSDANYVYVLAVDADKNPTLVKADLTGNIVTTYNTDFCSVSTDGVMKLSDIALTEDGVLVGCNQEKCQFAYSGNTNALNIYKWAEDGTGSVDFTYAYAYLVSMTWGNGYTGVTMAVKGTLADGQILIAGQSASGSAKDKMKQLLMEIKNDSVNKASVNTQEKKIIPGLQNINYPATSQFITMGTEKVPQLFEYDNTGGIDKYEVEKGALPAAYKGVTGATVFANGNLIWMMIPAANGVKILDITKGLNAATVEAELTAKESVTNDFMYAAAAGEQVVLMRGTSVETFALPAPKPQPEAVNTIAHVKECVAAGTIVKNDSIKVKGYIASMFLKPGNFAKFGSVCIWLTDTLGGSAKEFELYNCYGMNGDTLAYFGPNYTTEGSSNVDVDTIVSRTGWTYVKGDYIEAAGKYAYYSNTHELAQGCYITAGGTEPKTGITVNVQVPAGTPNCFFYGALSGNKWAGMTMIDSLHYTINFSDKTAEDLGWGYKFAWDSTNWNTQVAPDTTYTVTDGSLIVVPGWQVAPGTTYQYTTYTEWNIKYAPEWTWQSLTQLEGSANTWTKEITWQGNGMNVSSCAECPIKQDWYPADQITGGDIAAGTPVIVKLTVVDDNNITLELVDNTPAPTYATLAEAVAGKTIRRAVSDFEYVYVLAVDADKNPTLVKADFTGNIVTTYKTNFCSKVGTVGLEMGLSDIALTEDGVLVGCNLENCKFNDTPLTNAFNVYKWNADGTGSVAFTYADPFYASACWSNGLTGVTMAYKGTLAKGQMLVAGRHGNALSSFRHKQVLMVIDSSAVTKATVNEGRSYSEYPLPDLRNINYPAESQFITLGSTKVPELFEYVNNGAGSTQTETLKGALPADYKGVTGATVFADSTNAMMFIPSAKGVQMLDITNGLNEATVAIEFTAKDSIKADFLYAAIVGDKVLLMRDAKLDLLEQPGEPTISTTHVLDGVQLPTDYVESTNYVINGILYTFEKTKSISNKNAVNHFGNNECVFLPKDKALYNASAFGEGISKLEVYANLGASAKTVLAIAYSEEPITSATEFDAKLALSTLDSVYDAGEVPAGAKYIYVKATEANAQIQLRVTYEAALIPVHAVTFDFKTDTIEVGDEYQLSYYINPINATDQRVSFQSLTNGVVTVSETGYLTAVAEGDAVVVIQALDSLTPAEQTLTDTCYIHVYDGGPKPEPEEMNTIAHIRDCYDAGTLAKGDSVNVKGYIVSMFLKPANFVKYGSVCIWITDTLGGATKEFELYNCYGMNHDTLAYFGPNYTTEGSSNVDVDTIVSRTGWTYVKGDYIEATGIFDVYSSTLELKQDCYITFGGTLVTDVEGIAATDDETKARKVMRNGTLYIIRNNRVYTADGQVVE